MRVWLDVPYEERLSAKSKGAWWDATTKRWFVDNPTNLMKFKKWIPSLANWDESKAASKLAMEQKQAKKKSKKLKTKPKS